MLKEGPPRLGRQNLSRSIEVSFPDCAWWGESNIASSAIEINTVRQQRLFRTVNLDSPYFVDIIAH